VTSRHWRCNRRIRRTDKLHDPAGRRKGDQEDSKGGQKQLVDETKEIKPPEVKKNEKTVSPTGRWSAMEKKPRETKEPGP